MVRGNISRQYITPLLAATARKFKMLGILSRHRDRGRSPSAGFLGGGNLRGLDKRTVTLFKMSPLLLVLSWGIAGWGFKPQ